jgi:NAD(P)-dependent dehydrogenase (short-subunit alcohol dehydrogenase family)
VKLEGTAALVSGGASGLGGATVREIVARGGRAAILDRDGDKAQALAEELGEATAAFEADVTDEAQVQAAVDGALEAFGDLRLVVGCAGIGWAQKVVGKNMSGELGPADLQPFETVIRVNLIGMYNVLRLGAAAMNSNDPGEDGERGCVVMTASIAAWDGQIGQTAYSASKGGVAALTLPAARDLSGRGIRVNTIAPGLFDTPLLAALPQEARDELGKGVPFPPRLGDPHEFALLACHIAENQMLNGETIRLDGALRMPPR